MKYFIDDNTLTDIADAIREKTSSNDLIKTLDMPDAIRNIKGSDGGVEGVCVDEDSLIFNCFLRLFFRCFLIQTQAELHFQAVCFRLLFARLNHLQL